MPTAAASPTPSADARRLKAITPLRALARCSSLHATGRSAGLLALATNYQDLWWARTAAAESGWGINLSHQGDTIFATWFTYDIDGSSLWLVVTALKTAPGVYTGDLYRTSVRRLRRLRHDQGCAGQGRHGDLHLQRMATTRRSCTRCSLLEWPPRSRRRRPSPGNSSRPPEPRVISGIEPKMDRAASGRWPATFLALHLRRRCARP